MARGREACGWAAAGYREVSVKIISGIKTKARVILLASSTSKLSLLGHAGSKVFPRGRIFWVTFPFLCLRPHSISPCWAGLQPALQ